MRLTRPVPRTEDHIRFESQWRKVYHAAERVIRDNHRAEFDKIYAEYRDIYGDYVTAYSKARGRMTKLFRAEYLTAVERIRIERGLTRKAALPRRVNLTKRVRVLRAEMDPLDALILHERGMTVPEMARYDRCTHRAALKALVPQLARRRSGFAGWWETQPASMSATEIADRIGACGKEVSRVLAETA